jgi:hypothetical protein
MGMQELFAPPGDGAGSSQPSGASNKLIENSAGRKDMADISTRRAMTIPILIMLAMMGCAAGLSLFTGVDGSRVFLPYLGAWASLTLIAVLFWAFVDVARMAKARTEDPLRRLAGNIVDQQKLVLLPAVVFPLFIGAYTWAKSSIPFVVGYGWERYWADIDAALLGSDGWRIMHSFFPVWLAPAWTFFYAVIWGFALGIVGSLVSAFAAHRFTAIFFTAMMLSWFVGGFLLAYAISAAGPIFAHLVDPSLNGRFLSLREQLLALLGSDDIVIETQRYLAAGFERKIAVKGGGISAMPSMHIATATIFLLAAGWSRWLVPALAFWVLTFLGSVYLGYHYAVDAPVAAIIATLCWLAARRVYREPVKATADEISVSLKALPAVR